MFTLVADHQWPRITTYLESLKRVFRSNIDFSLVTSMPRVSLLAERVSTIPSLQSREWEDDNGLLFAIPLDHCVRAKRSVMSIKRLV